MLTSDTLLRHGGRLAEISAATREQLARDCRPDYRIENPVDLGDMAGPEEYGKALDLLLQEPGADGVLVIHAPASVDRAMDSARAVIERAKNRRLIMSCWVGESSVEPARDLFRAAHIPTYETARRNPDRLDRWSPPVECLWPVRFVAPMKSGRCRSSSPQPRKRPPKSRWSCASR
ncbi:MAG: hypothetical protein IPL59_26795 [Candidatus Competibacteraceae bacterium]|nr:hypothetical protein [Candidatus Competibacteraceae bacterium]